MEFFFCLKWTGRCTCVVSGFSSDDFDSCRIEPGNIWLCFGCPLRVHSVVRRNIREIDRFPVLFLSGLHGRLAVVVSIEFDENM